MRVLVADDERNVAAVLATMVRHCNHEVVDIVSSGGLEVIHSYARHKPDVVLMDFMMPHLNGLTACRAILSRDPKARVVLLSGKIDKQDLYLSQSGAMAVLPKPVPIAQLAELLDVLSVTGGPTGLDA